MEPKIIFEDEEIMVLNKPSGIVVNRAETTKGETTVQDWIDLRVSRESQVPRISQEEKTRGTRDTFFQRSGIVHRLDKETSGILLVAKTPEAFTELQRQFKERIIKKTYIALVHGKVEPAEGEINAPVGRTSWNRERFGITLDGKEARTRYKVVAYINKDISIIDLQMWRWVMGYESSCEGEDKKNVSSHPYASSSTHNSQLTLVGLFPESGRTHQIRVHMQYRGYPLVGDEFYAGKKIAIEDRLWCSRVFLHATKISFLHPKTGKQVEFKSKLPEELKKTLTLLSS